MSADGGDIPAELDCPFCLEPIRPHVLVCRHCRRDVSIPMPLLLAQREQAAEIKALRSEIVALQAEMARPRADSPGAMASPISLAEPATPPPAARPLVPPLAQLALGLLASFALVLAAHWFMVIRSDVATAVLRAACIGLPFTVSLCLPGLRRVTIPLLIGSASILGMGAVLAMSAVVARQDGTPVLPATGRDLFEMLEFSASIGLSFLTGALILQAMDRIRARAAKTTASPETGRISAAKDTHPLMLGLTAVNMGEVLTAVVAAVGALITGFRSLFG
jgi:hypothetical protein